MTGRVPLAAGWRARVVGLVVASAALALVPTAAAAQRVTSLTLSGWPLTVTQTTGADFEAGFVTLGSTTITVDAVSNSPAMSPRTALVQVQCVPACPRSGTLPLAGVQWRRDDQVAWTTLTTAYVTVESRQMIFGGANDPWSRTMHWRYQLSWTANPPTAASEFRIRYRLTMTAP